MITSGLWASRARERALADARQDNHDRQGYPLVTDQQRAHHLLNRVEPTACTTPLLDTAARLALARAAAEESWVNNKDCKATSLRVQD